MRSQNLKEPVMLSVITPAYNEFQNLPIFYDRLRSVLDEVGIAWEWIVADDYSQDETDSWIKEMAGKDTRVQSVKLARNFGSHTAIFCGLELAKGNVTAVLASDLQDPLELIPQMFERWHEGFPLVWAVRKPTKKTGWRSAFFSRLYYWLLIRSGLKSVPPTGADCFLMDRDVLERLKQNGKVHQDLFVSIHKLGFPSASVIYEKEARKYGKSGWTLRKKVELFLGLVFR